MSEQSTPPTPERPLVAQLEFYMSDLNLSSDLYLQGRCAADGSVPLADFLKFSRVKAHGATLADLQAAVRASAQLVLSEDGARVRRATPLCCADVDTRSVTARWVPCSLPADDVTAAFAEFGTVMMIKTELIRGTAKPRGTVHVEFESPDAAARVLTAPRVMVRGKEVVCAPWRSRCVWVRVRSEDAALCGELDARGAVVDEAGGDRVIEVLEGQRAVIDGWRRRGAGVEAVEGSALLDARRSRKRPVSSVD